MERSSLIVDSSAEGALELISVLVAVCLLAVLVRVIRALVSRANIETPIGPLIVARLGLVVMAVMVSWMGHSSIASAALAVEGGPESLRNSLMDSFTLLGCNLRLLSLEVFAWVAIETCLFLVEYLRKRSR